MALDPNNVTGQTEQELRERKKKREETWRRDSFYGRLNRDLPLSALLLIVVSFTIIFFFLNMPDLVSRMGALWVVGAIVFSTRISAKVRQDNLEAIVESLKLQAKNDARVACWNVINDHVKPDSRQGVIGSLAGGDVVQGLTRKLALLETRPTKWETGLAIFGTFVWGFGDWITCSFWAWELNKCS